MYRLEDRGIELINLEIPAGPEPFLQHACKVDFGIPVSTHDTFSEELVHDQLDQLSSSFSPLTTATIRPIGIMSESHYSMSSDSITMLASASNACLSCRKVKMKCRQNDPKSPCERCARKSLSCVFQEHRRGRKPGTRISKAKAKSKENTLNSHASAPDLQKDHELAPPALETNTIETSRDWQNGNLQPSGLLNHAATHGKFSLESVLNPSQPAAIDVSDGPSCIPSDDPIQLGYINLQIAGSLFDSFMQSLNPYICQMDPVLHTLSVVRQRCSFLFTAILAATAKALNPALYTKLHDHAENLFAKNFRLGRKSAEIAQAALIMTYWKDPEDTRAWISVGYVIRMGMDLGWHRLVPSSAQRHGPIDEKNRETRNVQRLWYILFVYDRSISLQTGKPWMIERNAFIESIETWCRDSMSTANDRLLGALVTLRLLSSEVFKLLGPKSSNLESGPLHSLESLLSIIKARIEEWEDRWLRLVDPENCHQFLIRFYGTHLRLQLFSLPLQEILASKESNLSFNLEALWVSYSSAMEMMRQISRCSTRLYFAQDSIHVMTAYSATFLIKLLLSAPESITSRIDAEACDAIRAATDAFSQQSSPPGSSCYLQARFLEKIMSNYTLRQKEQRRNVENTLPEINRSDINPAVGSAFPVNEDTERQLNQARPDIGNMPIIDDHESIQRTEFAGAGDEIWSDMFASAGFCIQEGVFFA